MASSDESIAPVKQRGVGILNTCRAVGDGSACTRAMPWRGAHGKANAVHAHVHLNPKPNLIFIVAMRRRTEALAELLRRLSGHHRLDSGDAPVEARIDLRRSKRSKARAHARSQRLSPITGRQAVCAAWQHRDGRPQRSMRKLGSARQSCCSSERACRCSRAIQHSVRAESMALWQLSLTAGATGAL